MAVVDEVDLRRRDREVVVLGGHRLVDQVGERAGELDAGRAAADDDEVERTLVDAATGRGRPPRRPRGSASAGARRRRASRAGTRAPPRPGVRKKFGREPAASTSTSPAKRSPSAVVTVRAAGSTDVDLGRA